MASTLNTQIIVDNGAPMPGHFAIDREVITYSSATATQPSMGWTQIDDQGHFHAYDEKGELPTLQARSRHVDCDGSSCGIDDESCEGYDVTEWFCSICDQQIEPERLSDTGEKSMPGLMRWWAEINPEREIEGEVTVRVKSGDRVWFGVARAHTAAMEGDSNVFRITTRLDGIGPLGQRRG